MSPTTSLSHKDHPDGQQITITYKVGLPPKVFPFFSNKTFFLSINDFVDIILYDPSQRSNLANFKRT